MARVPDEELKKAFTELQNKMIDTKQKLKLSDVQIEALRRKKQHAELTIMEVSALPENTRTFESVGRMFLLEDINNIKADIKKRTKNAEEKIKTLETNKGHLTRSYMDSENNLREMVIRKQNQESNS